MGSINISASPKLPPDLLEQGQFEEEEVVVSDTYTIKISSTTVTIILGAAVALIARPAF